MSVQTWRRACDIVAVVWLCLFAGELLAARRVRRLAAAAARNGHVPTRDEEGALA